MKLRTVRVQNFRSVEDSGEFSVEHQTCLVGKNEAGKTAILQALAGLNPHPATPFAYDIERDYPKRFLARYRERHPDSDAIVATTTWAIEDNESALIEAELGEGVLTENVITVARAFNKDNTTWTIPVDEKKCIENLVDKAALSAPERRQLGSPETSAELLLKLTALEQPTPKHVALNAKVASYPARSVIHRVRQILEPYFPQFMYFSNYDRMDAVVHLPTLDQMANDRRLFIESELRGRRLFYEFLEYSGVPLNEILGASTFESFNARLQAASNSITEEILSYWSQNQDIEVRVNVTEGKPGDPPPFNSGAVGRARIYNQLHKADTSFSERSAGFTWFFSFLVKFDRVKKDAEGKVFLLLDEPGLTLHGLAQADLLRYFSERLSPHHQLIYSTHSPFMVPHENLLTSRIVEDLVKVDERGRRTPTGTKVREDILLAARDSVFPLQGALGYSLTQSLFVGKHTILVEGPGDILYLKALSAELVRRTRVGLDPSWVLCPTGGIDKIQSFVSLFGGNKLDVISLSDYTKKDRNKLDALKRNQIIKEGGVLTMADFTGQEEADVEDLFEPQLFCEIINASYGLSGNDRLDLPKLEAADGNTCRQVKKAEAYFRTLPQSIPEFDHFTPAGWLIANPHLLSNENQEVLTTLDRAENLFNSLNRLRGA
jgi:energy-coupling factor transporter ATP-binding protein EcfA2